MTTTSTIEARGQLPGLGGPASGPGSPGGCPDAVTDCQNTKLVGFSPCCVHCHTGRDGLQRVYLHGEIFHLCCVVVTEIMARWPGTIAVCADVR